MSQTDKDAPYLVRLTRNEVGPYSPNNHQSCKGLYGAGDSGFRKLRKHYKKIRSRKNRRSSTPNWKRTWDFE